MDSKAKKGVALLSVLLAVVLALGAASLALAEPAAKQEQVEVLTEALDYSLAENWSLFAEGGAEKPADVFWIAPLVDTRSYANSIDLNDKLKARFDAALLAQRGIYEGACRIYSPYYRQVSLNGYLLEGGEAEQARKNAYLDVSAAFRYYLDHENGGRPIVLAGFSQGSQMCIELLKEYFGGDGAQARALRERLVTVFAIGFSETEEALSAYPQIVPASGEGENGTVVMFDCEDGTVSGSIFIPRGKKGISINPLNWKTDSARADKSLNKGAVINGETIPALCGCYIDESRGSLIVTDVSAEQYKNPLPQLFENGSFHTFCHMFFFNNLKENLELRVNNYTQKAAAAPLDIAYLLALQGLREKLPALGKIGDTVCELSALLLPALCAFLYIAVDKRFGRIALLNFGASELANLFVKNTACVPRPYLRDARIVPVKTSASYSMPSGHTMYATSILGSIAAWQHRGKKWIAIVCIALIVLVGFIRNFVGAHTPQDVAVSMLLTVFIMLAVTRLCLHLEKHPEKTELFLGIGAAVGLAVLLYANLKSYPVDPTGSTGLTEGGIVKAKAEVFASFGKWMGLLLAIFIDRRFIRYEINKAASARFAWGALGAALFAAANLIVSKLKVPGPAGMAIWFAVYILALALIPMAAQRLAKKRK